MKLSYLVTLTLLMLAFSCQKEVNPITTPIFETKATDQEGTIGFWNGDGIDKYTIYYHVPGTIDSQVLGIVDDLDSEFRTEGLQVVFSGEYSTSTANPNPILGGQSIYSLTLTSIELK